MEQDKMRFRDGYIDFLRAIGLLLLIGVHVNAPEWYKPLRSFDVPLMVFISAVCYKPLRGGYLAYGIKRFKRIYTPVFVFLTLFFIGTGVLSMAIDRTVFQPSQIIGSYLMLNSPSIGYVWIMRIFLLMALIIPLLDKVLKNVRFIVVMISIFIILIAQSIIANLSGYIDNSIFRFLFDEIILYMVGYSPLVILGLKIKQFKTVEVTATLILLSIGVMICLMNNDWNFTPNKFKYPPVSLYLMYGLFASCLLWSVKPILGKYITIDGFNYLSKNSMWIYLWHIVPVYMITPIDWIENTWFLRYMIVIFFAIGLYFFYSKIIGFFPEKLRKFLQ